MSVKVYLGSQTAKGVQATDFINLRVTDPGITYGIEVIESTALTGKEWTEGGITTAGQLSGSFSSEMTRALLKMMATTTGFTVDDTGADTVMKAPKIATYSFFTIVKEFTDDAGKKIHEIYNDCIINTLSLAIVVDAYVIGTWTPISLSKPQTIAGEFIPSTIINDSEKRWFSEKSIIILDGNGEQCEYDNFTLAINNNLSTNKVICGAYKMSKGGQRSIEATYNVNSIETVGYMERIEKSLKGEGVALEVTLKNADDQEILFDIPKMKFSTITTGSMNGSGTESGTLTANWDDTANTSCTITSKGTGGSASKTI